MKKILFVLFSIASFLCANATTFYVNINATGLNNGSSWENAFTDIQNALSIAIFNDQVWVAGGIYYSTSSGDRDISFVMKNTVDLYGGFNGTETSIEQRNITANPTTLSGDIGQPGDNTDNTKKIVRILNFTQDFIFDGFQIVSGYDGGSSGKGAAIYMGNNNGAQLYIRNCLFFNNYSYHSGGAIIVDESNVTFDNCDFLFNATWNYGGGAIYSANVSHSNIYLNDCVFNGNQAREGAVIKFLGYDLHMERNVISNNTATNGSI